MDHVGAHVSRELRLGNPLVSGKQVEHFDHLVALLIELVVLDAVEMGRGLHRVVSVVREQGLHCDLVGRLQLNRRRQHELVAMDHLLLAGNHLLLLVGNHLLLVSNHLLLLLLLDASLLKVIGWKSSK